MNQTDYFLLILGVVLMVLYRNRDVQTGSMRLPPWAWKAICAFLIFMALRNIKDVISFFTIESDQWFPIIKSTAHDLSEQLRHLFKVMKEGGNL
ncbi:hypothetical protein [Brevibacillus sp. SYSU BS000544]|uniref:hypothetical protein n=1 Tax=Brevibacillus sp. SYSU BS000544 TaxID=3416443 RepID=UPI003CE5886D